MATSGAILTVGRLRNFIPPPWFKDLGGGGLMEPHPRVFDMLQYFETIFPSVESLWSSQQDEVYFIGGGATRDLWRHKQWAPSWSPKRLLYYWVNKIVRYSQDFFVWRFVVSRFHCITKPCYREQILPVPWPFVKSRFHWNKIGTPGNTPGAGTPRNTLKWKKKWNIQRRIQGGPPPIFKAGSATDIVEGLGRYLTNNVGNGNVCQKTWTANDGEE